MIQICRNHIMDACIECQSSQPASTDCNVAWGTCKFFLNANLDSNSFFNQTDSIIN